MTAPGSGGNPTRSLSGRLLRPAPVIIVGSVMFTFISYWRTAAIVLCDLASTAYYIGGIVENAIGPAAPWFIVGVMLFSYAVRAVYIESCCLFVRGGVYRVVRESMGPFFAKIAVSALLFDYVLTGPISGVSAGQYLIGLGLDTLQLLDPHLTLSLTAKDLIRRWGSVLIACGITTYFFRLNLRGIHESSGKALYIMIITTVMAGVMIVWCLVTLALRYPEHVNSVPLSPDLQPMVEREVVMGVDPITGEKKLMWQKDPVTGRPLPRTDASGQPIAKFNPVTGHQEDALGFLGDILPDSVVRQIRNPVSWLGLVGAIGLLLAFGHSILAMSGEETLAQVYREVEAPKLANFKKAAFIVFICSLVLTGGISFLAVLIIPDTVRMKDYSDNLIGGLAMYVAGPLPARLLLNAFVTVVGFLILAGAVNTAIIGSNGVLNRVAEDGVLPDAMLKPHPKFGTTFRLLYLIYGLQMFTIIASQGNMFVLGEAYAFGVVWSFVFKALSMVLLRFTDRRPREFKVPFNVRVGSVEVPIGLSLVLVVLLITAGLNLLTKEVATVAGIVFTLTFFTIFTLSERWHKQKRRGQRHEHLEQFNQQTAGEVTAETLGLTRTYRKLVAIRSTRNLYMLEKALAETDPETTDVVVMTAKVEPAGGPAGTGIELDPYDQELMTAVVTRAEAAGKEVKPIIVPTNNPLHAVLRVAKDLQAQELIIGMSNKYSAEEQLDQMAFYWLSLHGGQPVPLTIRILRRDRDVHLDLAGGNRIPRISERQARTTAELRAAGVGVARILLAHDGSPQNSDLFQAVLTMIDSQVVLDLAPVVPPGTDPFNGPGIILGDRERAGKIGREMQVHTLEGDPTEELLRLVKAHHYDLLILGPAPTEDDRPQIDREHLLHHAPCHVFLATPPPIPQEVEPPPPSP